MATLFYNCLLLRNHQLVKDDLWVADGRIVDPEDLNFRAADSVDCRGRYIAPGFIDLKLNGAFGVDFSTFDGDDDSSDAKAEIAFGINKVAKGLPAYGVTSFCPTIVSTSRANYHKILPHITPREGSYKGAGILGVHVDGPFINEAHRGAHPKEFICHSFPSKNGITVLEDVYGSLENVKVVTLAPELEGASEVVEELSRRGIIVSLGHSGANLEQAEKVVKAGASMISHLFNAMPNFHHRDPSLLGLLASDEVEKLGKKVHFGIIADGVHTHPAALRMALKISADNLVIISDAIAPMGLPPGQYCMCGRDITVEKSPKRAYVSGTDTLFGSVANFDSCLRLFREATGCSTEFALEAASLHPAECLGLKGRKGTLDFGADADFVMLDEKLHVVATYILGNQVYSRIS